MRLFVLFIIFLHLSLTSCDSSDLKSDQNAILGTMNPRVLFITSGFEEKNARMPAGVIIAVQSFNQHGIPVRLETRDILYDLDELSKYSILILSTFPGYYDADRRYSLSFMSDDEISNISKFVMNGGVIITGDNVGRNYLDGTDRIVNLKKLTDKNWKLSLCYGSELQEKNLTGYAMTGEIPGYFSWKIKPDQLLKGSGEFWTLVFDSISSPKQEILGYWSNGTDSLKAVVKCKYGKGTAYHLSSSALLHPVNEGGFWSYDQIENFYAYIADEYTHSNQIGFSITPWPNGHDFAFCASINASGNKDQFERVLKIFSEKNVLPTFFVNGNIEENIMNLLINNNLPIASCGFSFSNYKYLNYQNTVGDILQNNYYWNKKLKGFRFPYTSLSYNGLLAIDDLEFSYESSIGANNIDFINGSVVPYNLVFSNKGYYRSTDIMEIAATYYDDYHFLNPLVGQPGSNPLNVTNRVDVYRNYLTNYWDNAVKPFNGLMVFLGHPNYVGANDTTVSALAGLIDYVKKDNTWITSLEEVCKYSANIRQLIFYTENKTDLTTIHISGPENILIQNIGLKFDQKINKATAKKGEVTVSENLLLVEAFNGQEITVRFK